MNTNVSENTEERTNDQARFNMVEQQIRTWDVLDQAVLDTLFQVPREDFVPQAYRAQAFTDIRIPLGLEQEVMMPPNLEGRILQCLALTPDSRALEIGTGSGFLTACMAKLAGHVDSIERDAKLSGEAADKLAAHDITNVTLTVGDACAFAIDHAAQHSQRYNAIAVTGSIPERRPALEEMLEVGGRLCAVIGNNPIMQATLITRISETEWLAETLCETHMPPLKNCEAKAHFEF